MNAVRFMWFCESGNALGAFETEQEMREAVSANRFELVKDTVVFSYDENGDLLHGYAAESFWEAPAARE